jgi:hypothetical protein
VNGMTAHEEQDFRRVLDGQEWKVARLRRLLEHEERELERMQAEAPWFKEEEGSR